MTQSDYAAEVCFRLCKGAFATLLEKKLINGEQFQALLRAAAEKYHAPIGELEVNGIA